MATPRKKAAPKPPTGLEEVVFLDEAPPEARTYNRDDDYWQKIKHLLEMAPNKWAKVKVFENNASAGQRASAINRGKNKMFPSDCFEARYSKDESSSTLFLVFKG
jgi:hypothetical protein